MRTRENSFVYFRYGLPEEKGVYLDVEKTKGAYRNAERKSCRPGFANWYKIQAQEERDHAMLFYQYLHNNNAKVTLGAIAQPDRELSSDMAVLQAGLEHELYVTGLINEIYAAAHEVKDFRTMQFLDWFVKEQGEEEDNANDLISKMELFGSDPRSLYMLNSELAGRVYSAPSLVL